MYNVLAVTWSHEKLKDGAEAPQTAQPSTIKPHACTIGPGVDVVRYSVV